ncbi:hypothetical protein PG988_002746 [Apiospora saccharicola]
MGIPTVNDATDAPSPSLLRYGLGTGICTPTAVVSQTIAPNGVVRSRRHLENPACTYNFYVDGGVHPAAVSPACSVIGSRSASPPTVLTQRRGASHGPPDGADNARRVEASVVEPRLRRRGRARRPRREAFGGLVDPPATLDGAAGSGPLARLALP